ncbi:MAG: RIP metalloprotease RseP [Patescibacteria group bacterium]|nr:RIP metalloprotease RseP [Patescibacteria group bacterium]
MLLTIIVFIVVLSVLVFVHEAGHFWAARKMGVKVEEFGFGLPPRAIGALKFTGDRAVPIATEETVEVSENMFGEKKIHDEVTEVGVIRKIKRWKFFWGERLPDAEEGLKADDTVYSINWLLLGGFCKIKGENGEGENDQDSFVAKAIWKRIVIISAGVIMNVVLAMALFAVGYMIGLPQSVEDVGQQMIIKDQKIQITQIFPNTPAAKAGLKPGDVIVAIDGQKFTRDIEVQNYVNAHIGSELDYQIRRVDKITDFKITPVDLNGRGGIGVGIINTGLVRYPWYLAIWKGITTAIVLLWVIIVAFYELLKNLILGHGVSAEIAGPVGIATMTGQYARMGFVYLLQFVGLLSLNLAVVNFLPIPALDGGRIIFLLIEKFKGSPIKREIEAVIHNIGFFALIILILFITGKEILGLAGPLAILWQKIF